MAKPKQPKDPQVKKDFIEFLAKSTPDEIYKLILEKGKPGRHVCPLIFSDDRFK